MPRVAIRPSRDLAELLRRRRKELKITLREAEERSRAFGNVIPFSTLGKVEQGRVDPGVIRFQQLLDIYDIPKELALDVVALETLRGEAPDGREPEALYEDAVRFWNAGQTGKALGAMYALRKAVTGPAGARCSSPEGPAPPRPWWWGTSGGSTSRSA
jgi:transcriptional regulator with XRE-family HTH domain